MRANSILLSVLGGERSGAEKRAQVARQRPKSDPYIKRSQCFQCFLCVAAIEGGVAYFPDTQAQASAAAAGERQPLQGRPARRWAALQPGLWPRIGVRQPKVRAARQGASGRGAAHDLRAALPACLGSLDGGQNTQCDHRCFSWRGTWQSLPGTAVVAVAALPTRRSD